MVNFWKKKGQIKKPFLISLFYVSVAQTVEHCTTAKSWGQFSWNVRTDKMYALSCIGLQATVKYIHVNFVSVAQTEKHGAGNGKVMGSISGEWMNLKCNVCHLG